MQYGWDHPETARAYEAFCSAHSRYLRANQALIAAAALAPGQRILDLAAGTGRTSELVLKQLDGRCDLVCLEPARAMRELGEKRIPLARWTADWPLEEQFDRILCGSAIWQLLPLVDCFRQAAQALRPGGALVFDIPGQYVCQPDEPGGGDDPWLTQVMGHLAEGLQVEHRELTVPHEPEIEAALAKAGFRSVSWCHRTRLTQAEYRDWLKIPVLTDALLTPWTADERAVRIDAAYARSDAASWRWEAWRGWTAWK